MALPRPSDRFVVTRRRFLAYAGPTVAAVGSLGWTRLRVFADTPLLETPSDDEGPFYREGAPERADARWTGSTTFPLTLSGLVRAEDGKPLADVVLDLWHADSAGAYDMRTKDFRHRAKVKTDAAGRWRLLTNVPGQYGYTDGRMRPRHIHVKLSGAGVHELTTQMYFQVRPGIDVPEELFVPLAWEGKDTAQQASGTWNPILARKAPPAGAPEAPSPTR